MGNLRDITGKRYGQLIVLGHIGKTANKKYIWECLCDCGNKVNIPDAHKLKSGVTLSCGCLGNGSHYMSYSSEYGVWSGMVQRCTNPSHTKYHNYGGRGIGIDDGWDASFELFYADMGPRPSSGHTIERRDTNGNYSKENCYWTDDLSMQSFNQRRSKANKSGRTGVRKFRDSGKWVAEITVDYKTITLGYFKDFDLACFVREEAELKYYGFIKE